MKVKEYNEIVKAIKEYRGLTKDCAKMLMEKYNDVEPNALKSILSHETQEKMKWLHKQTFGKNTDFYKSYLDAVKKQEPVGILLRTAQQLNICPALLARTVLEQYCKHDSEIKSSRHNISKMMKDTTLIEDQMLAYEIYLCSLYDDQYGFISIACNASIGKEYELKLEHYLKERDIQFYNEDHLRLKGYDKTPDCKLEVPIAVNGFVVNWIESKAQFGTPDVHKKFMKEQFLSYWNRFGPGLVIYWFGFVDSIVESKETKFIIMDHFPENITYMDPSSIRQALM